MKGVAAADVYLTSISDIVADIRLEKTGGIFLVDTRTGTIIGHPDTEMNGRSITEFTGDMYAYAAKKIQENATGLSLYNDDMYIELALRIRLFTTSITVSPLPDCHKIRNISPVPFDSAIIFFIPVPSSFDADLIAVLSFSRPDISYFITIFIL